MKSYILYSIGSIFYYIESNCLFCKLNLYGFKRIEQVGAFKTKIDRCRFAVLDGECNTLGKSFNKLSLFALHSFSKLNVRLAKVSVLSFRDEPHTLKFLSTNWHEPVCDLLIIILVNLDTRQTLSIIA